MSYAAAVTRTAMRARLARPAIRGDHNYQAPGTVSSFGRL